MGMVLLGEKHEYGGHTTRFETSVSSMNKKGRLLFTKKYRDKPQNSGTKINLHKSDGKESVEKERIRS